VKIHPDKDIRIKPVLAVYFLKWANAGRCWAADQHLLRSYKRFECNRDPKLSEVKMFRASPVAYDPSINLHLLITLWGATLWRSIHRMGL